MTSLVDRSADGLVTGILTNLNYSELVKQLGERVIDWLKTNQAHRVEFNWESYRSNASTA
jgi:DNA replication protein DnaC